MLANSAWRCQRERILQSRDASVGSTSMVYKRFIGYGRPIKNSYIESFPPASKDWLEIRKLSVFFPDDQEFLLLKAVRVGLPHPLSNPSPLAIRMMPR